MVGDDDDIASLPSFSGGDEDEPEPEETRLAAELRLARRVGQKPWLLVVGGRHLVGRLFEVKPKMTIGRAEPVDILLDEEGVSRSHARIEIVAGGVVRVSDLGSSNGIRVDGRLVRAHSLRDGERLRLGEAVLTLVHIDDLPTVLALNLRASVDSLTKK